MSRDLFEKAGEVFKAVIEHPREKRAALMDAACADDADLRGEVESLLAHHEDADGALGEVGLHVEVSRFLEKDAADAAPEMQSSASEPLPARVGRYRIIRKLGEGGMGSVFEAEQENPHRTVALKIMRAGILSPEALRRFAHESEILGRMHHPGIAQIYEAGTGDVWVRTGKPPEAEPGTAGGDGEGIENLRPVLGRQPYFAMELVRGQTLMNHAVAQRLGTRERLQLFSAVCDAVQYAHRQDVIHRDLKPANILIDEHGQPKVLDFGVARLTSPDAQLTTLQTGVGQLIGTLSYMSPEQVSGDPSQIDARSDVYSLGVLLFELLTGRLPYRIRDLSIPEGVRVIREQEPTHLSSIDTAFRGDLETIVIKALEKEKERRYSSAAALAEDLRRFLRDEPIVARRQTTLYQLRKFARRNKALVGGVAVAFLALLAGAGIATWQAIVATHAHHKEAEQRGIANRMSETAHRAEQVAVAQAYRANIGGAEAALRVNNPIAARRRLEDVPADRRDGWEWRYLNARLDRSSAVIADLPGPIRPMVLSPDGRLLAVAYGDNDVQVWAVDDVILGAVTPRSLVLKGESEVMALAVSPAFGAEGFLAVGDRGGRVRVWRGSTLADALFDASTAGHVQGPGRPVTPELILEADTVVGLTFDQGGERLIAATAGNVLFVWTVPEGRLLERREGFAAGRLTPSNDASQLFTTRWGVVVARLSLDNPRSYDHFVLHDGPISRIALGSDGSRLITASEDKTVRIFDTATDQLVTTLEDHSGAVYDAAVSPDGHRVATASADQTVRVWDLMNEGKPRAFFGHTGAVLSVLFAADGRHLLSGGADRTIRCWELDPSEDESGTVLRGHNSFVYDVAFSPDGSRIASAAWDGTIRVWSADTYGLLLTLPHPPRVSSVRFSPDGRLIASLVEDESVRLWDAETGSLLADLHTPDEDCRQLAFVSESTALGRLVIVGGTATLKWDIAAGAWLEPGPFVNGFIGAVGGSLWAIEQAGERWRIVDLDKGEAVAELENQPEKPSGMGFSHDGNLLATANLDGSVRVYDTSSGRCVNVLRGHLGRVHGVAFSPEAGGPQRLASGSDDNTIRIWDPKTGEQLLELRGHAGYVKAIAFSPDGASLVSASGDHTVRIWDTRGGRF